MISGPRIRVLGPVLAIEAVTNEDAGTYKCLVSNTGGEASVISIVIQQIYNNKKRETIRFIYYERLNTITLKCLMWRKMFVCFECRLNLG